MRMRTILRGALCAVFGFFGVDPGRAQTDAGARKVDLELVLAADVSGSMDLEEAQMQRRGIAQAIRDPQVIAAIQAGWLGRIAITYVEWAGAHFQETMVTWSEISDAVSADAFAAAVERHPPRTEMYTSISSVIAFAAGSFDSNGFDGHRQVIDISGDGPNNRGPFVTEARDAAVARGVVINGLPIMNERPGPYGLMPLPDLDLYYEDCVIGGAGSFVIVANGFEDFARAIRQKLLLEISDAAPRRAPAPLLRLAVETARPPCNAGEVQLRRRGFDDY